MGLGLGLGLDPYPNANPSPSPTSTPRLAQREDAQVEEERGVGPARVGGEGSRAEELVGDLARGDTGEIQGRYRGDIGELLGDLARARARAGDRAGLKVGVGFRVRSWG